MNLEFWDFEEWVNRANIFPIFLDWSKGCQIMFVLGTHWSWGCGAYKILKLLGISDLSL